MARVAIGGQSMLGISGQNYLSNLLIRHMMANKFSELAVMRMIEGLVKDGYTPSKFLPEGWRVRYVSKLCNNQILTQD